MHKININGTVTEVSEADFNAWIDDMILNRPDMIIALEGGVWSARAAAEVYGGFVG